MVALPPDNVDILQADVRRLVRSKARRLVGRAGIGRYELEDAVHDLDVRLLFRLHLFDPALGPALPFINMVLEQAVSKELRQRSAAKRDRRREVPFHTTVADDGERYCEPASAYDPDAAARHMDVADAVHALPPHLRSLAEMLKTLTLAEIARRTGIPRTTLSSRKKVILDRFRQAGLDVYL